MVWTTRPNQFVAAELADLPPGRALDLAAGEGRNTVWLAERGWQVTAVDFSRVGLEKGRKLSAARGVDEARVDWIVADLRDFEPDRAFYHLVLIAYLQVSPELRATVMARAAAALAPGGTAFVVGHDLTNLTEGTGGPQDPDVLYTPEAVRPDCPDCASSRPNGCTVPSSGTEARRPPSTPWSARSAGREMSLPPRWVELGRAAGQAILRAPGPGTGVTSRAESSVCPAWQDICSRTGSPQSRCSQQDLRAGRPDRMPVAPLHQRH